MLILFGVYNSISQVQGYSLLCVNLNYKYIIALLELTIVKTGDFHSNVFIRNVYLAKVKER
jgi:hypothetical protein